MSATQPFARSLTSDPNEFRIALRSLYREVSRRVHPDLTRDASDRLRRENLMRQANQAYEDGDSRRLRTILQEYEIGLEPLEELAPAAEVIAAVRGFTRDIRLQLTLMERFGNDRMKQHRSLLAQHLLATPPGGAMSEEILNFFDEMDLFHRSGYLEERILWSTFGFSACRWWAACNDCVVAERRKRNEATLFTGFENLALRFAGRDAQAGFQRPTPADLRLFLEGERRLTSTLP